MFEQFTLINKAIYIKFDDSIIHLVICAEICCNSRVHRVIGVPKRHRIGSTAAVNIYTVRVRLNMRDSTLNDRSRLCEESLGTEIPLPKPVQQIALHTTL